MNNIQNEVMFELRVSDFNLPNNIRMVKGDLTLNEIEKKAKFGDYIFDRGMSIKNLNKTLNELEKELPDKNSHLIFFLLKKSEKLIKDLEESEINFINIDGESCYQSATLQGFVHIIFPLAIKNLNKEREKIGKEKVKDLDELKNDNIFNNTVIDTLKGVIFIQGCGNGGKNKNGNKRYEARKLFEIAPPIYKGGQDPTNAIDSNQNHGDLINNAKNFFEAIGGKPINSASIQAPPKKKGIEYKFFTGEDLIKIIEIDKKTIVSEIVKFKVEGNNKYYGNLVLKFNKDNLNDPNLDICKLIENCPQIKKNNEKRKIIETSDIIYMITDRLETLNKTYDKQFNVYETIYFDNINGCFNSFNYFNSYIPFELKFVIFHYFYTQNSGHYVAYCKIKGEWHLFNDLNNDYAKKENPPLINNTIKNFYPLVFYYVKNKNLNY